MRRHALRNETKVALNDGGGSFFDRPFADIGEGFTSDGGLLRSLRGGPPFLPTFGELFEERSLDFCGLDTEVRLDKRARTGLRRIL